MARLIIVLMLFSFILSSCYQPVTEQQIETVIDPVVEDVEEEPSVEVVDPNPIVDPILSDELPERNFTIANLQNKIMEITGEGANFRIAEPGKAVVDSMQGEYLIRDNPSPLTKNWVIHVLEDSKLKDMPAFVDKVKSPQWNLWRYYINETEWNWLHEPLSEAELHQLLPKYPYRKKYLSELETEFIHKDIEEKIVDTTKGYILRFSMLTMIIDRFDYWQADWEKPVLVYKIPCTDDLIVYMKPEWSFDFGNMQFWNQKKDTVLANWHNKITAIEPEMIDRAEVIMEFCGVGKQMSDDVSFQTYKNSEDLYHNWRVYYRTDYEHEFSADVTFTKERVHDLYYIDKINLGFTDLDGSPELSGDYSSLYLKVTIDDSGEEKEYIDQFIRSNYRKGDKIEMEIDKDLDVSFSSDAEVILRIYKGDNEMTDQHRYYIGEPIRVKLSDSVVAE